ncbi:MAG: CDC48 family AAA ATPase [archaeon]|nr:CDC48 family AAA ATPase [archaeon]MDD2477784.1 CDC48 family AAA ATPase [Candidatus ainarchaeum sp.]MDD3084899.1 CDC48 family AAA ATPase [Candidatus ainarchaeum sp.]MDD4221178.1 CDC48 family AAA ATPase [Candidatus ainarchaeum sp.]MDD4662870.1 CDC48 family AAA ATPase [Candidatus ainarchaeum sp.]
MIEKIILTVKETDFSEVGKGKAKIDPLVFDKMKLSIGDVILIEGNNKKALAYATRGSEKEAGLNIIKIDGVIRYNAGATIDEDVFVEKTNIQNAQTINLSPIIDKDKKINLTNDIESMIKDKLLNLNVIEKNIVKIPGLPILTVDGYRDLQLIITKTIPKGAVRISENTKFNISEKSETTKTPNITYDDIGGLKKEIEAIREMVELPIRRPEIFKKLGISPPKGVLLYGPPGTGKTLLAKAVASETDANFTIINGPEIIGSAYGQSEANLRKIFEDAEKSAPSIIFIDEIDAIAPKRENIHGETEKRIVAQLLTLMDGLTARGQVVVIAATNIPDVIDPALRRPGRFDRELEISVPDKVSRKEILQVHLRGMPLEKDINVDNIVELINGFSGADINALVKEAALKAIKRLMPKINKETNKYLSKEILDQLIIKKQDLLDALNVVEPSALREVQIQVPNVKWEDIGGLDEQKQTLKELIEWPIKYKTKFEEIGIDTPSGVLLYGPPGTGKTLIAKAIATESNANFISVKGPEIFNKWVGESEKKIRDLFKKARQVAPSIIFFDEIDSITRSRTANDTNDVSNKVVAQILTEMDGISQLKDIIVIGATNRIDMIDPAFLRPGRFDVKLEIPLPKLETREKIFEVYIKKMNVDKKIKIKELAKKTDGASGADIEAICREAGMFAIRENIVSKEKLIITSKHFEKAIERIMRISESKRKEDSLAR